MSAFLIKQRKEKIQKESEKEKKRILFLTKKKKEMALKICWNNRLYLRAEIQMRNYLKFIVHTIRGLNNVT